MEKGAKKGIPQLSPRSSPFNRTDLELLRFTAGKLRVKEYQPAG
jgi:hypothetical protein